MSSNNEIQSLITEERNPRTKDLDLLSTIELVNKIQAEDAEVIKAVQAAIPQIVQSVDLIVDNLRKGGRLIYFGAGTSGRLGILDASECPPTFGVDSSLVSGYIAGGKAAMFQAVEGAEDSPEAGAGEVILAKVNSQDIVVGIAASGRTPYVIGALQQAKKQKAHTIAIINNKPENSQKLQQVADIVISLITGPEALTGSTRMKAGSAQKMTLNLLSTCSMIKLGKAYENLMVDLTPTNDKLRQRACAIISLLCTISQDAALQALNNADNNVKTAILMLKKNLSLSEAKEILSQVNGSLRLALKQ